MAEKLPKKVTWVWGLALFIALVLLLTLVVRAWPYTWDDSAITLAFSRNLAHYGDIVPTPLNERVEGYSSFLWMVLNAIFFRLGLGEDSVITLAKVLSTGFALANVTFFWKLLNTDLRTPLYRLATLALFTINSYTVTSAVDGMETSLYAFLVFAAFFSHKKRVGNRIWSLSFALSGALLILIRHEGALFLVPFAAEMLIRRRWGIFREHVLYFWAFVFLAYHTWHYAFFGEVLTNPMLAKRFWPYGPDFTNWPAIATFYLTPVFDFVFRYISIFTCLPIYFFLQKGRKSAEPQENWTLVLLIALTAVFVILITGQNWGAAARLSYPGLPFLLLLLFSKIDDTELLKRSRIMQSAMAFALLLNAIIMLESAGQIIPDVITLAGVERRASVLEAAKNALGRPEITIASADMGGLLLYHANGMKVIDLGLLCNKELAKNGYAHYDNYIFEQSQPEMITAVGFWVNPLRKAAAFTRSYFPVVVITERDQIILYMRQDVVAALDSKYAMPIASADSPPTEDANEQGALADFGKYRILDLRTQ